MTSKRKSKGSWQEWYEADPEGVSFYFKSLLLKEASGAQLTKDETRILAFIHRAYDEDEEAKS